LALREHRRVDLAHEGGENRRPRGIEPVKLAEREPGGSRDIAEAHAAPAALGGKGQGALHPAAGWVDRLSRALGLRHRCPPSLVPKRSEVPEGCRARLLLK